MELDSMVNGLVGDGYMTIQGLFPHSEMRFEDITEINKDMNLKELYEPKSLSLTVDNIEVEKLFGLTTFLPNCEAEWVVAHIQKRKHKKRRINKKWGKRYGYYTVKVCGHVDDVETWSDKETFNYTLSNLHFKVE